MSPFARRRRRRFQLERLEERLPLSLPPGTETFGLNPPANAIALSQGNVASSGATSTTRATINPVNITPGKKKTQFAIFVQPTSGSGLLPRIISVTQNGHQVHFSDGRPFTRRLGSNSSNRTVAFIQTGQSGPITIEVSGRKQTTGQYTVETTLPGDVNGDGQVTVDDLLPFSMAYATRQGETPRNPDWAYNASADYNQNGLVNLQDALALERNMTPLTPNKPLTVGTRLAPANYVNYPGPKNSGGQTNNMFFSVVGKTTPGSIVLIDGSKNYYTYGYGAVPTNSNGIFRANNLQNTEGLSNINFKVIDPFSHQKIRMFPVIWLPFNKSGTQLTSPIKRLHRPPFAPQFPVRSRP